VNLEKHGGHPEYPRNKYVFCKGLHIWQKIKWEFYCEWQKVFFIHCLNRQSDAMDA